MVKKTLFKYSSVLMSVVLIASTLTACGTNTAYNQVSSEVAVSSEAASNTESIISNAIKNELSVSNTSTLKTNTRDEMVYVFGKADGTQDHVTVTEKVTDANGDTTTNQSSSSKSAPVSMKVTYKLNGVETKPEDMIGKSGKVTIRYDYINNEKKTIKVNGKSQTAYVPFTMITGTLLPTDKFSNVEVTNGKVSKVGDNIIALGMTMPGLKDTLNLKFDGESLDMDIPEYFEISADVNDFELDMSMSVATTSVLNDVDVDDFSLAKLEDKMNDLFYRRKRPFPFPGRHIQVFIVFIPQRMHTVIIPGFLVGIMQNDRMQQFFTESLPVGHPFVNAVAIKTILHVPLQRNKDLVLA